MLTTLHIRNFALIDELELTFGSGLNILTGETGAGKSIIIDALGTVLGERTSPDYIRTGADRFSIQAVFSIEQSQAALLKKLSDAELDNEDDPSQLIIGREINRAGKSSCRVNGRIVPLSILKSLGEELVDVHGQHEHQSLLSPDTHIDMLDNWIGEPVPTHRRKNEQLYGQTVRVNNEIEQLTRDARDRARNIDLYRFQLSEISEANLSPSEVDELLTDRSRLSNTEKLSTTAEECYSMLNESALSAVNSSLSALERASTLDVTLNSAVEQLREASAYLEEAVSLIRHYRDDLEAEPGQLEAISERLDLIHALQRKYGDTVEDIIEYGAELETKLSSLEGSELRTAELERARTDLRNRLESSAKELTLLRTQGALQFADSIEAELADLGMLQTKFRVALQPQQIDASGADRVEFVMSPNPGEPLRPLAKIASGGEASRIMLAIKSVLLRSFLIPTMIFDEIDSGVGGRTGRVIAEKLSALGELAQILCITHLPQIASRPASRHFFIEKSVKDGRTVVSVVPLGDDERVREIARMLGGETSQTVIQHAREMLLAVQPIS